jgi:hypothetical protein
MPSYSVSVPHDLGQTTAHDRVIKFLDQVRRDHADTISDTQGEWKGYTLEFAFSASGLSINGSLVVEEQVVHVAGPLPFLAGMFRGRIEQTIREELEKLLG